MRTIYYQQFIGNVKGDEKKDYVKWHIGYLDFPALQFFYGLEIAWASGTFSANDHEWLSLQSLWKENFRLFCFKIVS